MSTIAEKCMIVRLSVSQWSARKLDRKATEAIIAEFKTAADSGRFNKLLVNHEAIKKIQRINSQAWDLHKTMTLPWTDDGGRVLPAELFLKYTAAIQAVKERFEAEVKSFVGQYEAFKAEAKIKLNGLYNEADYPRASEIAGKFGMAVAVEPIPQASDFRVALSKSEVAEIRKDIEERMAKRISDAMKDAFGRLYAAARSIADKCKDTDAIFRDSLIGNLRDLLDVLPALNVTNDPELIKAIAAAAPLAEVDPQALRDEPTTRSETAKKAEALAKKLKGFII